MTASSAINSFNATSASYALTASSAVNSFNSVTASFANSAISVSYASASTSASWALTASSAINSFNATSASYSLTASSAVNSFNSVTASFANSAISVSYASASTSASWALTASSAINSFNATSASWSSASISASYAPQAQNISVNSITASYISCSNTVQGADPMNANDLATKAYVDANSTFGVDLYFRSASSTISTSYNAMYDIETPISGTQQTLTFPTPTLNSYIAIFLSPALGVTMLQPGNITVHFHAYYTGGGTDSLHVTPEIYMWNSGVETELITGSAITLNKNGTTDSYTSLLTLTSSINTNISTSLVCKFKTTFLSSTPIPVFNVEGQTAAGVIFPIPSSNFVTKTGDTMTGALINPYGFVGTSSWASSSVSTSYSPWADYARSSSWASSSISSSRSITASYASGVPTIKSGIVSGSAFSGSSRTSSVSFTKPFPNNNYSITVTGDNSRTWTISNRVSGSFTINTNSAQVLSGSVYWQAITVGEFYS